MLKEKDSRESSQWEIQYPETKANLSRNIGEKFASQFTNLMIMTGITKI